MYPSSRLLGMVVPRDLGKEQEASSFTCTGKAVWRVEPDKLLEGFRRRRQDLWHAANQVQPNKGLAWWPEDLEVRPPMECTEKLGVRKELELKSHSGDG